MNNLGFTLKDTTNLKFSGATDYEKAKKYTDEEIKIKSVSVNGEKVEPDNNKNVDIDGNTIVSESYLKGNGAPTSSTQADFVGQMYLDTANTKLYQCVSITTNETDGTKSYSWIKVIRDNDVAGTYGTTGATPGIAMTYPGYGTNTIISRTGTTRRALLSIYPATTENIDNKSNNNFLGNTSRPIVPSNLDYAVRSVRPVTAETVPTTLAVNTLYSINNTSSTSIALTLPQGQNGDFIQYDFVTGTTAPTVTIQSTYGMTEFDFTPEANKIYSLFFDWGIIAVENSANVYGWRISYAEYDYTPSTAETTGNDTVVKANDDDL